MTGLRMFPDFQPSASTTPCVRAKCLTCACQSPRLYQKLVHDCGAGHLSRHFLRKRKGLHRTPLQNGTLSQHQLQTLSSTLSGATASICICRKIASSPSHPLFSSLEKYKNHGSVMRRQDTISFSIKRRKCALRSRRLGAGGFELFAVFHFGLMRSRIAWRL